MYCGDETGGVVFDAGSYTCKVGYAGDDMPKSVFNGRAGVLKGVTEPGAARASTESAPKTRYLVGPSSTQYRPHMELRPPTDYGLVEDWDMMEAVWAHGFDSVRADPREHPLVLSEPPFSIMAQREKVAEIMFETFDVPAMYLARQPQLAAFSTGRASGIVVDLGHACTRVTPLYDGYIIQKGLHMSEIGGHALNVALHEMLLREAERGGPAAGAGAGAGSSSSATTSSSSGKLPEVLPRYAVSKSLATATSSNSSAGAGAAAGGMDVDDGSGSSSANNSSSSNSSAAASAPYFTGGGRWRVARRDTPHVTPSFHTGSVLDVYDDMKRSVCEVAELGVEDGKPPPGKTYELPDGNTVTVGLPRQLAPELLFRSDLIDSWRLSVASRTTANWTTHYNSGVIMRTTMPPAQPGGQPVHAVPPLQQMVYNALLSCSPEVRRELCGHVILTGGGSLLKDLHKRLHWEMLVLIPAAFKPRVVTPAPTEREYANWIGGSVLASLGTFQQMWVSRAEYDEEGPSVVERKCS